MIEYTVRTAGLSHDVSFANQEALLSAFGKWQPEDGLTVHAFVSHLNSNSGYVLVEADDPKVVSSFVSKFVYWNDVDVRPVVDVEEIVAINTASLAWAQVPRAADRSPIATDGSASTRAKGSPRGPDGQRRRCPSGSY